PADDDDVCGIPAACDDRSADDEYALQADAVAAQSARRQGGGRGRHHPGRRGGDLGGRGRAHPGPRARRADAAAAAEDPGVDRAKQDAVGWAKRSVPTIANARPATWARRWRAFATLQRSAGGLRGFSANPPYGTKYFGAAHGIRQLVRGA